MSVTINGTTGIDKITDGSVVAADLASTLDLSGKTITLATDAAVVSKLSTASGSAPSYSARAWVNFNGSGTVAIRDSGNVSSITDNGTGLYTINFTTAMSDANYSIAIGKDDSLAGGWYGYWTTTSIGTSSFSTRHSRIDNGGTTGDCTICMFSVFR